MVPCLLFEDEHLLVVNKPAGMNTHAPAPFAGEGLYDWLRHREPRWASLALLHRLDKETSGVLVFGKTPLANRALTEQFTRHEVRKTYWLATDRVVRRAEFTVASRLVRAGERYVSNPVSGERAETQFRLLAEGLPGSDTIMKAPEPRPGRWLEASPITGRTHQIRVHAAAEGLPILGDTLYGGTLAQRVFLHAAELTLRHPATIEPVTFRAPVDFAADPALALRTALVDPDETDAFRLRHGAADALPGCYVDRLGPVLLAQAEAQLTAQQIAPLRDPLPWPTRSLYFKRLQRRVRSAAAESVAPQWVAGETAPDRFLVRENGVRFELSLSEGYSTGLFLDQRDNRRRLLTGHVAAGFALPPARGATGQAVEVLNLFAYTCGFSVCAARAGARVTSVDLSRKYLEWGRRHFALNELDPEAHDFIYGDTFDWLKRFARKGRRFDVILADPPTFSASKASGVFQAERHYGRLVAALLPVLQPGGVLFASTNAAGWPPEAFLTTLREALSAAGRKLTQEYYAPQPPDFPVSRAEPAYLKTVWLRVA